MACVTVLYQNLLSEILKRNKSINNLDFLAQFCTLDVPLQIESDLSKCIS